MWWEWGEGRYNTEPTQYSISHRNRWLLHRPRSGGNGRCEGNGGKDVTILNQLNIQYHTEIDDCYTGLGVTGDVGGMGGRTLQYWTNLIFNITQKSMIVTQVWGWREMWGEWEEGRHNTEPTQYWISHRNRWLLHRSGGDGRCGGMGGRTLQYWTNSILNITQKSMIVTQVWGWREMWGEWGEGCYNTEPSQYRISHRNRWLLRRSGGDGRCGGMGGRTLQYWTNLIFNITQKSMIVTQVWGWREMWGNGGKDVTILNQLNIQYHTEIDDCYTVLGVTGDVGEWGEGRHNTEPTQYWISHKNRWLLHKSGGDGRCGGNGGKDVTILNQLNIEYHTEIDDCYTGLGVTGDVGGMGGRTLQYWTNLIFNITQKSMIVTQVWGWREMWGNGGKDVTILNQLNIQYHTEIDDCYTVLGVTGDVGEWGEGRHNTEPTQYWISHKNRWLLHKSGGDGRCGGNGGKDVTILNQLNIEYHTKIDDCYTGLGVTGDVGGMGGRTSQYWTNSILNITQKSMIVTQVLGWREMWGEWGEGRHNTEPTQYWISHRNRWLLHRSGGNGRCGGSGGRDVTILNQLNIEYHTEIDDCYTGLGVTGDVVGMGGRTSQDWTYSIWNITQTSMIVTQVWG